MVKHREELGLATGGGATETRAKARLEAVVLAAGAGVRFGGGKLVAPLGEGVLLDGALRAAFAAPVRDVTVVTGADSGQVAHIARAFDPRVKIVHAAEYAEGMGASLRTAIASLPADADGVFVFLGDMPRVPPAVFQPMVQALAAGAVAVAPVFRRRRGNPVLLGRDLFPQLVQLKGDAGARAILQALGERLALVDAPDDGVLFDVDQPADLGRA